MGGRYLITGTQLGMLIAMDKRKSRQKMITDIVNKQHIEESQQTIQHDVKKLRERL